jgi:hypothetical protein
MTDDQLSEIHQELLGFLAESDPQQFDVDEFVARFELSPPWYVELRDRLMKMSPPIGSEIGFHDFHGDPTHKVRFSLGSHTLRTED